MRKLFKGGKYSRAETIRGNTVFKMTIEINKLFLGEYKLITLKQLIFVFYVFKIAVAIAFLCENAVEAI